MSDFDQILAEYKQKTNALQKNYSELLIVSTVISALLTVLFAIFRNISFIYRWLFYLMLILLITSFSLYLIIISKFSSDKLLFEYLYPKIIDHVNSNNNLSLEFQRSPRDEEKLKKAALIPPEQISISIMFKISYGNVQKAESASSENVDKGKKVEDRIIHLVDIYDIAVILNRFNTSRMFFRGNYYIFHIPNNKVFQIKSRGEFYQYSPGWPKLDTREDVDEYIGKKGKREIEKRFYDVYDFLSSKFSEPPFYIGGIKDEIHVAVSGERTILSMPVEDATHKKIDEIKKSIHGLVNLSEDILKILT
ncbi:MAG: hypothetical protein GF364_09945 [Candidatus Lokiarchaeota archaeon]|nr:hypothetical protein [Candidatus Lokiarchaeota archaeon]